MVAVDSTVQAPLENLEALAQRYQAQPHTKHLLQYFDILNPAEKNSLLADITTADPDAMATLFSQVLNGSTSNVVKHEFDPPVSLSASRIESMASHRNSTTNGISTDKEKCVVARLSDMPPVIVDRWRSRGLHMLATCSLGAVILAGGQGTRLGWSQPKGMYPIGAISKKSFFQLFIERVNKLRALSSKHTIEPSSVPSIPIYIMTSEQNRDETIKFFVEHNYFGFPERDIMFFLQDSFPCLSRDGKLLLSTRSSLARSPNGNGSVFASMARPNGVLDDMKRRGLVGLHVIGIDNALTKILDPVFIGYVDELGADVGNKVVTKVNPDEKIGIMCTRKSLFEDPSPSTFPGPGGKNEPICCIVEYSELPVDMRTARDPDGGLTFRAGNICSHYFRVDFIERILSRPEIAQQLMGAHIAYKKIPVVDPSNPESSIIPKTENGIKLEYFIFDYFPFANRVAGLEGVTASEFACVKNATGTDSPESCQAAMTALYKSWLATANGSSFSGEGHLEISSLRSYGGEDLDNVIVTLPSYLDRSASDLGGKP